MSPQDTPNFQVEGTKLIDKLEKSVGIEYIRGYFLYAMRGHGFSMRWASLYVALLYGWLCSSQVAARLHSTNVSLDCLRYISLSF